PVGRTSNNLRGFRPTGKSGPDPWRVAPCRSTPKGSHRWREPFVTHLDRGAASVSDRVDVQRNAGAERGRHRTLLDVAALGARRLQAHDLLESCTDVLIELLRGEGCLADDEV